MSKLKIIDSFFKIKKDSTVTNLTMVHSIDILHINFNHLIIFRPKVNFWLHRYEKVPIECEIAYLLKM